MIIRHTLAWLALPVLLLTPPVAQGQTVLVLGDFQTEILLATESGLESTVEDHLRRHRLLERYLRTRLLALGYEVPTESVLPRHAPSAWWEVSVRPTGGNIIVSVAVACRPREGHAVVRLTPYYLNLVPASDLEQGARKIAETFAEATGSVGDQFLNECIAAGSVW